MIDSSLVYRCGASLCASARMRLRDIASSGSARDVAEERARHEKRYSDERV